MWDGDVEEPQKPLNIATMSTNRPQTEWKSQIFLSAARMLIKKKVRV